MLNTTTDYCLPLMGWYCCLVIREYANTRNTRIDAQADGEGQIATLSVNTDFVLLEDEFVVNNTIVQQPHLLQALLDSPLFEDTGIRVGYGYVTDAPIFRYLPLTKSIACDFEGMSIDELV